MIRKDIYVKMLQDIAARLNFTANASPDKVADFADNLSHYRFEDAIDTLEDTFFNCRYYSVFNMIRDVAGGDPDRLDEAIPVIGKLFKLHIGDELQKVHLKRFVYAKPDLVVLPTRTLFDENGSPVDFFQRQEVFVAIEEMYNNAEATQIPDIWDHVDNSSYDDIFIVCAEPTIDDRLLWRKYAYACLCHVENRKFDIPSVLQHTVNSFYSPSIIFWDPNVTYEQFFDVYNVLNEVKHAGDFLTIYLKIYQALEYFAYRLKLVEITKGTPSTRQSFIRRLMSVTDSFRKAEEKEFCDGFKKLFPAPVMPEVNTLLQDPGINAFVEKYYKVKYQNGNEIDKYAKVVYQLRNSIVHNKEAELHFSYGNLDEYTVVIPLIKQLVITLGCGIVHIINNPPNQDLIFDRRELNLY